MRRKFAIKPKNLPFKIGLCEKLRNSTKPLELSHNGYGFTYYRARYGIGDLDITVYFQRYVRHKSKVDYIKIYHTINHKNLTKSELDIINTLV